MTLEDVYFEFRHYGNILDTKEQFIYGYCITVVSIEYKGYIKDFILIDGKVVHDRQIR